jgi:DNA mismatch repair protein MutS
LLEEIKEEILNLDINTITPMEALMKLNEIKRMPENKFICFLKLGLSIV